MRLTRGGRSSPDEPAPRPDAGEPRARRTGTRTARPSPADPPTTRWAASRGTLIAFLAAFIAVAVIGTLLSLGRALAMAPGPPPRPPCPTTQPEALPAGETRTVTLDTALGAIAIKSRPTCPRSRPATSRPSSRAATTTDAVPPDPDPAGRHPVRHPGRRPDRDRHRRPRLHDQGRAGHDGVQARHRRDGPDQCTRTRSARSSSSSSTRRAILASANTYQIIGNVSSGMETADAIFEASSGVELPAAPVDITTATVTNP